MEKYRGLLRFNATTNLDWIHADRGGIVRMPDCKGPMIIQTESTCPNYCPGPVCITLPARTLRSCL